ncbi:hypothetical protein VKT23_014968 [Stygiomarasmius scandens]|uniref:Uncharacterized protein n=1 Tax=Marasmiellus scandens TaxID=2682957 RepID=A0ABR1IYV3_9AGAR
MRFQLSQEQIDFYFSLPQEVKQHFVDASLAVPAHLLPPGIRRLTSLDDFDQALRETHDVFAPEIDPQPDAIQTYLPHLGFGIRYWLSHCLGKDGYYNFDFIDRSGERINTPPGIRLIMEYNFHVRSTVDIQLTRKPCGFWN